MSALNARPITAADAIARMRSKGVRLWVENGSLRYRAPKGRLSAEEFAQLRALSEQIVTLLQGAAENRSSLPPLTRRAANDPVPLSFSQLRYWRESRLDEQPAWRAVATAVRISGPFDDGILRESLAEVVRRHEPLRTLVVGEGGVALQKIAASGVIDLQVDDLRALVDPDLDVRVESLIHEVILQPVYLSIGPLCVARLMRLRDDEHVLFLTMDHIISDGVSINLLIEEVLSLYSQLNARQTPRMPEVPIQIGDFAVWQEKTLPVWLAHHGSYWARRLAGCPRLRLPEPDSTDGDLSTFSVALFKFGCSERASLKEWSRSHKTTLTMTLFTVFVAVMLRRCRASDGVIRFETDGRFSPLLERSIGYFASALNLRIELGDDETFLELLERVTREYCASIEHADRSYLDVLGNCPNATLSPGFNWVPQAAGVQLDHERWGQLSIQPFRFGLPSINIEHLPWDWEPSLVMLDFGHEIIGRMLYSPRRTSRQTAQSLASDVRLLAAELIKNPHQRLRYVLAR